eukprot:1097133-Rhodomonas_salina.2
MSSTLPLVHAVRCLQGGPGVLPLYSESRAKSKFSSTGTGPVACKIRSKIAVAGGVSSERHGTSSTTTTTRNLMNHLKLSLSSLDQVHWQVASFGPGRGELELEPLKTLQVAGASHVPGHYRDCDRRRDRRSESGPGPGPGTQARRPRARASLRLSEGVPGTGTDINSVTLGVGHVTSKPPGLRTLFQTQRGARAHRRSTRAHPVLGVPKSEGARVQAALPCYARPDRIILDSWYLDTRRRAHKLTDPKTENLKFLNQRQHAPPFPPSLSHTRSRFTCSPHATPHSESRNSKTFACGNIVSSKALDDAWSEICGMTPALCGDSGKHASDANSL